MDHNAEAIIISCIDYRLQDGINNWIAQNFTPKTFDRVALAGGVKNLDIVLSQINIAVRLHHIKKVVLINHEDCGAYGETGTFEKHSIDLNNTEAKIKELYPQLKVEKFYLHLDNTFEPVN